LTESSKKLISGRLLARNTIWNFGGMVAPMLVAIFAIPLLIDGFGKERFGLLAIIWMGVGYFSLFDMGFGRALTKLVADRLGTGDTDDLGSLIWTALSLTLVFGFVGAGIINAGAGILVHNILNIEAVLQAEGIAAMRILAIGLPAVVLTAGLVGILQAHQRFATITAVRVPLGVLTFAGPVVTLQFSPSLIWATMALVAARLIAFTAYFGAAASVRPELKQFNLPQRKHIVPLFHFGGWLTVTNVVGPMMVYFDRFLIGAVLTMTAVSYYVTPYEVLSRLQLLPKSMMNVLFPALTTALMADKKRLVAIYSQASRILLLLVLPVLSAAFLLAPEALQIWLGDDFREMATPVVQWLAVGWLVNTLARMPFTVLQSAGRPDLVAKTHLLELLPYVLLLWIFTRQFGIAGTAAAWFLRVLADTIILNWIARSKVPELNETVVRTMLWIGGILIGFALAAMLSSLLVRAMLLLAISAVSAVLFWPVIRPIIPGSKANINKAASTEPIL
jgi:O-antigen/teichoic acid export membrane protein